jgi:hypothetical protein
MQKIVLVFFSPLASLSAQAKLPQNQASGAFAAPAVVLGIRQIQLEAINKKSNAETLKCQGSGAQKRLIMLNLWVFDPSSAAAAT